MQLLNYTDRAMWRLALPMIFSNITIPLLGLVNTAVVGHLGNAIYLAGVAIGAMATSFLFMLLAFLRMSTTGLTAQAFGKKHPQELVRALVQPLLLALILGVAIILFDTPLIRLTLGIVGGEADVLQQAHYFLTIRWLSAPAALANLAILGWLIGVQRVKATVVLLIIGNLLNIVLALYLVIGLNWEVKGVALATVISEYATLFLGLGIVTQVLRKHHVSLAQLLGAWRGDLRRLMSLNRDIILRSLLLQCCFASLTVIGARLGSDIVAVNAILMNLLLFTSYALDGFANAVEAYSGQAYGAKNAQQLMRVWRSACKQAGLVALVFSLMYSFAGTGIVALMTSLHSLQQLAEHYLFWQVLLPLIGVWCYLLDGLFIGATRGVEMRNSMLLASLGFALTLLTLPLLGNHALWLAFSVFLAIRGVALGWIWRRHWRQQSWFSP